MARATPTRQTTPGIMSDLERRVTALESKVPRPEAAQSSYARVARIGATCKVKRSVSQAVGTATASAIAWDVDITDDYGMHDPAVAPTRLIAPWEGFYGLSTTVNWDTPTAARRRHLSVSLNGSGVPEELDIRDTGGSGATPTNGWPGAPTHSLCSLGFHLDVGGYAEVVVEQNDGVVRNLLGDGLGVPRTYCKFVYLGPGLVI